MATKRTRRPVDGLSLVTGIGRQPLTRHQVAALGHILGTSPRSKQMG